MSNSHRNKWLSRRTSVARFCWHSHFKVYCFSSFTSASPVSWTGYLPNAPNIPTSSSLPILLSLSAGAEKHSVPSVIPSPLSKQVRMTFCPTKFFSLFNLFTSELVDLFSLKQGLSLSLALAVLELTTQTRLASDRVLQLKAWTTMTGIFMVLRCFDNLKQLAMPLDSKISISSSPRSLGILLSPAHLFLRHTLLLLPKSQARTLPPYIFNTITFSASKPVT